MARLRVGVIGLRFGCQVHVPAFRNDPRCEVVAVAGRDAARAADTARSLGVPLSFADWRDIVASPVIDVLSIAVPPAEQPAIIEAAVKHRKHVFCEKPVAASLADARRALALADSAGVIHGVDFMFPEIEAWKRTQSLLDEGVIGRPVHFAYTWRVETYASRTNADSWKNRPEDGGGVVGNFASHVFYNIERLLGPIRSVQPFASHHGRSARAADGLVELEHGTSGILSISTDAFLGMGHCVEIYGDLGTLVLHNGTPDHASGFRVSVGTRKSGRLAAVFEERASDGVDGRVTPVSSLVRRFVDAIGGSGAMTPNLADGVRVQEWLARASAARTTSNEPR